MASKNTFSSAFKKKKKEKKGFLPEKRVWFKLAESEKERDLSVSLLALGQPLKTLAKSTPKGKAACFQSEHVTLLSRSQGERFTSSSYPWTQEEAVAHFPECLGRQCRAQAAAGPTGSPAFVSQPNLPPHNLTLLKFAQGHG